MKIKRTDSMLRAAVLMLALIAVHGNVWAAENSCTYDKPISANDNAGIGGTGMGGTGVIAKGTGIGGTGIRPEAGQGELQLAGNVTFSRGIVEAQNKGRSRLLAQGGQICAGETIVTAQSGMVRITMTDNGLIEVRPQTQLEIKQFVYSGTNKDNSLFALLKGASRFVTGNIGKRYPQNDLIETKTATIGVRGTDHEVTVILPGDSRGYPSGTYDKVNQGITFIRTEKGEIDIHPDQVGLAVSKGDAPTLLKEIPGFYNTNPSLRERGSPPGEGKEKGPVDNEQEGRSPEHSGKGSELVHPAETGTPYSEHQGNPVNLERPESPVVPESPSRPELPESPTRLELPESLSHPELPESPSMPQMPEHPG